MEIFFFIANLEGGGSEGPHHQVLHCLALKYSDWYEHLVIQRKTDT
jgi:hypothetical protein